MPRSRPPRSSRHVCRPISLEESAAGADASRWQTFWHVSLPISASQLVTSTGIDWGRMTAIGTVVVLPMFVAGLAVKRWLVTGLTLGAVTGE